MTAGRVLFVGCGPGAADLLTLRAVAALGAADVVIWSASLIERAAIAQHMRPDAELLAWPPATQREIESVYDRAAGEELVVVRLKGGDPMLFGEMQRDLAAVRERGLGCEVVPGISALGASAAALVCEVATPAAPLLLVDATALAGAAATGCAVYGASADPVALQRDLLARGLPAATRCDVAIDVSRRGEMLVSCPLGELAETVADLGLGGLTLVLAGHRHASRDASGQD